MDFETVNKRPSVSSSKKTSAEQREERVSIALRENLRKRKNQQRKRIQNLRGLTPKFKY